MTTSQETWRWVLGCVMALTMTLGSIAFAGHDTRLDKLEADTVPTAVAVARLEETVQGLRQDVQRLEQAISRLTEKP
jgi:hypothetical protein